MEISVAVAIALILAAMISYELRVSSAILEVVAGIVLGFLIADLDSVNWLHYLSNLGVLALMFVAGFELRIRQLKKTWISSASIGLSSFALPFLGIYLIVHYWLGLDVVPSLLVGIGLSTTSLALVYHLLKEQDILSTESGQIMFGAASVVDIISMVCMALVLGEMGWGTLLFAIIFIGCVFTVPRFANWVFKRYPGSVSEPELRFLLVMIVGMGFMAEKVGHVHPALVAFTLGVFMARFIEHNKVVKNKLMALVFSFFAPIFFLHSGTKIELGNISEDYMIILAVLFVAATALKYLGTMIPARYFIKSKANFSGLLFNYRLSFGIITANVGLETGLISAELYAVIMLVVVSSAAIPSLFLRKKSNDDKQQQSSKTPIQDRAPTAAE